MTFNNHFLTVITGTKNSLPLPRTLPDFCFDAAFILQPQPLQCTQLLRNKHYKLLLFLQ